MFRWILCAAWLVALNQPFFSLAASPEGPGLYGTWWRGGENAAELKARCPWIKGVFAAFAWSDLEPAPGQYDWDFFEKTLTRYAEADLYIQFMVWVGPHSPRWIYEQGVPEVKTSFALNPRGEPHRWTYPFYLHPKYIELYHRLIRQVAARIDQLPPKVREKIVCIQTAEGTTGDEGGYKGEPLDKQYRLPEEQWNQFKFETWHIFDSLYRTKTPKIHLLINSGNQGQYHDWIMENMPDTWRKAGNPGHGYQLNEELRMIKFLNPIINHRNVNGEFIRCRSEMDEMFKGWFQEAPVWNMYWLNLWALHFGIDIFQHQTSAFDDPRHFEGFAFVSKYGGQKDPAESPGAWCALRDGLDAANFDRFPAETFGEGRRAGSGAEMEKGMKRTLKIAEQFAQFGAKQGDPEKGMAVVMRNRDADAMNDVGWSIWAGNYQRYLTQYAPNETSQGYWRVGSKEQPYGRFARGFDVASEKNRMFFDLDNRFFPTDPGPGGRKIRVRIVYLDQGTGDWALVYDAVSDSSKEAVRVSKNDTGTWKEISVDLDDALLAGRCPNRSDLMLVNRSRENTLFHMIEVLRR